MTVNLWKIPKGKIPEIKEAFESKEYYWLISQWNNHEVTADRICSTCPNSVDLIKKNIPKLWK